jgi:Ca2+-binding RTX toxin-like protein
MIDGLLAEADSELLTAQFTFINSLARGNNSFITGTGNVTLQDNSNALGQGLRATTRNQTVVGQYNADSDALFVVGCGQYNSTKNEKNKNFM